MKKFTECYNINESTKEEASLVVDLISLLHHAQLPVREIHWNTRENALHLTTDEAIKSFLEWEDKLAEAFISDKNITLKINDTKPASNADFKGILKDIVKLTEEVKEKVKETSIAAVIDDILEGCNKHLYRGQFK